MEYTTNYQLPVWAETDRILRTDFNGMTETIDSALDGLQTEVEETAAGCTAQLAAKGNCQLYLTSYVGTGGYGSGNPNTLTFPAPPQLVLIAGGTENSWGAMAQKTGILLRGGHLFVPMVNSTVTWPTTWSADGKTVSWYCVNSDAAGQMNLASVPYTVAAFFAAG